MERTPDFLGISVAQVMTRTPKTATPDELMISADQAMYASKRTGKNRVAIYTEAEMAVGGRPEESV